jgi:hypothetical protein
VSFDVRFAASGLARALEAAPRPTEEAPSQLSAISEVPSEALGISHLGHYFRPPKGGWVDLSRRRALSRLLRSLSDQRQKLPGEALPWEDLFRSGWPKEQIDRRAGRNRVKNALFILRDLGLRELLLYQGDGYLLDPSVPLVLVDEPRGG